MQNPPIPENSGESGDFSYFPQFPEQPAQPPPLGQPMHFLPDFLER